MLSPSRRSVLRRGMLIAAVLLVVVLRRLIVLVLRRTVVLVLRRLVVLLLLAVVLITRHIGSPLFAA